MVVVQETAAKPPVEGEKEKSPENLGDKHEQAQAKSLEGKRIPNIAEVVMINKVWLSNGNTLVKLQTPDGLLRIKSYDGNLKPDKLLMWLQDDYF